MDNTYRNFAVLLLSLLVSLGVPGMAQASKRSALPADTRSFEDGRADPRIARLQELMALDSLYEGAVTGILDNNTKIAIRHYQEQMGLRGEEDDTTELIRRLEANVGMRKVLDRLQKVRQQTTESARQALLANPATRHLIEKSATTGDHHAIPNSGTCFAAPTPSCLLAEAVNESRSVERPTLRNWVISEILVVQVKAGLGDEAQRSLKRLHDPRQMMIALGRIAEAEAHAGRVEESIRSATDIPDPTKKANVLATIAGVARNDRAVRLAVQAGEDLADLEQKVSLLSNLALTLWRKGRTAKARDLLGRAENIFAASEALADSETVKRLIATAKIEIRGPHAAVASLLQLPQGSNRTALLIAVAQAQAKSGYPQEALATLKDLTETRYRPGVLAQIAVAQAKKGDPETARATLTKALAISKEIPFPYARSYAASRVVMAMIEINGLARQPAHEPILARARQIDDPGLRAEAIWALSVSMKGDETQRKKVEAAALRASEQIQAPLSRAWMYANLAGARQKDGASEDAQIMFDRGMDAARNMRNAWTRARALAKLASTLIDLQSLPNPIKAARWAPTGPLAPR